MKIKSAANLEKYTSLVFDCDGVILNSNRVKTNAFYNSALPYGAEAAQSLANYHKENGGISRYKKFDHFLKHMIPKGISGPNIDELLETYASQVMEGLLKCELVPGLDSLRAKTMHANWLIVSGGDQKELREIFNARDLNYLFDGGIYGSPDTKELIISREQINGKIKTPAVFFGDSKYDFSASTSAGLDFVFVMSWSEIHAPLEWAHNNNLNTINSIADL